MRRNTKLMIASVVVFCGLIGATGSATFLFGKGGILGAQHNTAQDVLDTVVEDRLSRELSEDVAFGNEKEINILLLGLDQRKDWENPHCDAIHLFTLDLEDWTVTITSVPRGTYAYIPQKLAPTEYYMANTCSYEGLEYGIAQVEKLLGTKTDYYVTVNFSQTLGILRLFQMPTTESLQFLRHRQSYQIGDPQRSHNQAVFMKDLIYSQGGRLNSDVSLPFMYAVYNFLDTDLPFSSAKALIDGYLQNGLLERKDAITHKMVPYHNVVDMHFDPENAEAQVQALVDRIRPYLSKEDLSDKTLEEIQAELVAYMDDGIDDPETVRDVVRRQLWLQVEDEVMREKLHYDFIEEQVYLWVDEGKKDEAIALVSSYIVEKQALGIEDYEQRGKGLLKFIE